MSAIRIIEPGMLTTVQDLGRVGFAALGVPESGAADPLSLRIGNRLVGNADSAPGLEFTLTGGLIEFEREATIAVTGGSAQIAIEGSPGRELEPWRAAAVNARAMVRIGPVRRGCRVYLCVAGGWRADKVLGSASTNLGAAFGGHEGRALRAGDRLEIGTETCRAPRLETDARPLGADLFHRRTLRAVEVPTEGRFDRNAVAPLWSSAFVVSNHSDRAGIRLEGPSIPTLLSGRMTSEGMTRGTIEVPENGQPIILGVDHPTTGGYPALACVATVDLPILGQLRPRETIRFEQVSVREARLTFAERERLIDRELPTP